MGQTFHLEVRTRLALLMAILLAVGLGIWILVRNAEARVEWVRHTLVVELSLETLIADLRQVESAEHGFLLTDDARYLEASGAARNAIRREVSSLSALTADNPRQQETLGKLLPLVETRLAQFEEALQRYRTGPSRSSKSEIDLGTRIVESIQALAQQMREEENSLLALRQKELSSSEAGLLWALALGSGLVLVIVAILQRRTVQYMGQRLDAEQRLSKLNAELDQRVQERTASLRAREELLQVFVKSVPAAVAMLDREMRYLQVSDRWCADYGVEALTLTGRSHYEVFPDIPERWKGVHRRGLKGEIVEAQEDAWAREDGSVTWLHWVIRPWGNHGGLPEGILIYSEDITDRKRNEQLLRENAATTQAILDTAAQAILTVDRDGKIVFANNMTAAMFGYGIEDLRGELHEILVPERFRSQHALYRAGFAANPVTRPMGAGRELSGLRRDGSEFPVEISISGVETAQGFLVVSCISDISVRRTAEALLRQSEQQLRDLAGSLLTAQEDERRRLARELHDDLTQRLGFLSMELGRLASDPHLGMEGFFTGLRSLQSQTIRMTEGVRLISHGLHPSVIQDFGLGVALEEFCEEFERAQGTEIIFDGLEKVARLDVVAATCLYRIAQEAMRNAVAHGRATTVRVELDQTPERAARLRVIDDGVGFMVPETREKTTLGIVSMRERIRLVGGTLTISSEPGDGTEITAVVPIRETL